MISYRKPDGRPPMSPTVAAILLQHPEIQPHAKTVEELERYTGFQVLDAGLYDVMLGVQQGLNAACARVRKRERDARLA